jgi:hypothetical protein
MENLVSLLLNRRVTVVADDVRVPGRLIAVSKSIRGHSHKPNVLVLESAMGFVIIRCWSLIFF